MGMFLIVLVDGLPRSWNHFTMLRGEVQMGHQTWLCQVELTSSRGENPWLWDAAGTMQVRHKKQAQGSLVLNQRVHWPLLA